MQLLNTVPSCGWFLSTSLHKVHTWNWTSVGCILEKHRSFKFVVKFFFFLLVYGQGRRQAPETKIFPNTDQTSSFKERTYHHRASRKTHAQKLSIDLRVFQLNLSALCRIVGYILLCSRWIARKKLETSFSSTTKQRSLSQVLKAIVLSSSSKKR